MGLFDFFKRKKRVDDVAGTLEYIPGSQTPNQDEAITVKDGELIKRMYVQPEGMSNLEHSNIRIYTGNPFRALQSPDLFLS